MNARLLKLKDVAALLNCHWSTVFNLIKKQNFPKPIHIGGASRWYLPAVDAWILERVKAEHPEQLETTEAA